MKRFLSLFFVILIVSATLVVTSFSVLADEGDAGAEVSYNQGDDPAACLESAIEKAKSGPVKLVLGADMVFEKDIEVSKSTGNITIESQLDEDGTPKFSLVIKKGVSVTLYGVYEFKNVGMHVEKNEGIEWEPNFFDSGFIFPDGSSATFVENISVSTEENTKGVDLAGNVTIKAGTYNTVFGNGNITIDGGTFDGRVFGGYMVDFNQYYRNVTMTINDGVFNAAVLGGSLISGGGTHEGNVTVTIKNGTFNGSVFGGSYIRETAAGKHAGKINLTLEDGTFQSVYGGSSMTIADAEHSAESNLYIKGGTFTKNFYGGSYMKDGNIHSGAVTTTTDGGIFEGKVFGGSNINDGTHTSNINVIINGGIFENQINGVGSKGALGEGVVLNFKINGGVFENAYSISQVENDNGTNMPASATIDFSGWASDKLSLAYASVLIIDITDVIYPAGVTSDELAKLIEEAVETEPVETKAPETTPEAAQPEETQENETKAPETQVTAPPPNNNNEFDNSIVIIIVAAAAVVVAIVVAIVIKKKKVVKK